MKLAQLKEQIQKYQYFEDTRVIDIAIASIIATRLRLGDPIWLVIIGASSGGKSQILRPLALTDKEFIHRVDDLTENTLLSGAKGAGGEDMSLLKKIGNFGIIVISDLTVLFSKSSESRATILSQFRMLYDGEMTKHSGTRKEPIVWEGYLGVVSGSTPSIYSMFEEVADMGERFIYYRMKEIDGQKATSIALNRKLFGKELDNTLSELYADYIHEVIKNSPMTIPFLPSDVLQRIISVASFAERIRTIAQVDKFSRDKDITRIPVPALPMRVALQLTTLAKSLSVMNYSERGTFKLTENELATIDWCGYSLANEEKRACLKTLCSVSFDKPLSTSAVADNIGLSTSVTSNILQNLSSTSVLKRDAINGSIVWSFRDREDYDIVRRIESVSKTIDIIDRGVTDEEEEELNTITNTVFERF